MGEGTDGTTSDEGPPTETSASNAPGISSESGASADEFDTSADDSDTSSEDSDALVADDPLVDDDPLVVWALASFHVAALVAVLVVGLYTAGSLGDLLGGLDTVVGLALYLALWASTWWTTRRVLGAVADAGTDASALTVVGAGGRWGGVNGVCFLWVLLFVAAVPGADVTLAGVLYFLAFGGIGSILALGVGGIVGVLFAVLDLALFRAARGLTPASASPPAADSNSQHRNRDDDT
ncbi:hypothetical protein [Halorussus sp. MSC15.2]|uniref:hypothetical protein n=1 Tax=Halorussus sp. MSC15.2 TaxID=2283638 RepID=UPI0013D1024A|nr:hypothetical protein [Halorussus sp. MSC15.2]NEU56811.1 hypothetical protein [Halorussus sp. MSC15.2]